MWRKFKLFCFFSKNKKSNRAKIHIFWLIRRRNSSKLTNRKKNNNISTKTQPTVYAIPINFHFFNVFDHQNKVLSTIGYDGRASSISNRFVSFVCFHYFVKSKFHQFHLGFYSHVALSPREIWDHFRLPNKITSILMNANGVSDRFVCVCMVKVYSIDVNRINIDLYFAPKNRLTIPTDLTFTIFIEIWAS